MKATRKENLANLLAGKPYNGERKSFQAAAGLSKARLSQLLDAELQFGEIAARRIEDRLGLDPMFLDRKHYHLSGDTGHYKEDDFGNVSATRRFAGEVPVISWVQAGSWHEAQDPFDASEAERFLPIIRGHAANIYALRVEGDSMTAPYGKSYPAGCFIIVDPNRNSPVNGERIIAKLVGSNAVTFKVYKEEDGRRWLAPLNTTHQPIVEPFKVLGTVISKWEDE